MDEKLLTGLEDVGYSGPLLEKDNLSVALDEGAKNIEFTKLISFLTNEIRPLLNIDEEVNPISSPEDSVAFIMEVSSFLKELNCTYSSLTQGHISDRLQTINDKILLVDYLLTELMGSRIIQQKKPDKKIELKLHETEEAANLRKILMTLRFPKPPANITIQQLFQKVCPTVETTIEKVGKDLVGNAAFKGFLSEKQWETLRDVQKDLNNEYKIRREMLLTRLDVTIQSFQWSDRTKGKDELFEKVYAEKRKRLKADPNVELADLLAARDEIAVIEKTSSSSVRKNTRSSLNKVIIGQVPDRGGRTSEQAPPPPEMPSWQQRTPGPGGRGGRGGGGRGGGSFSRGDNKQNYSRGSSNSGGNYSRDSGSFAGSYSSSQTGGSYSSNPTGGSYSSGRTGGSYSSNPTGGSYSSGQTGGSYSSNQADYSSTRGSTSNYSNYDSGHQKGRNFDSAGTYSSSYDRSTSGSYSTDRGGSYGYDSRSSYDNKSSYDNRSSHDNRNFDSAGSYGKDQYEQNSKRAKTYDSFQSNRATYADQYVQEEQHNQQYHGRGENSRNRSRGSSNYSRGGGRNNY